MSFSLAVFDELNPCIHSILCTSGIHIFRSIYYLDRLQFFEGPNDMELNQVTKQPRLSSEAIQTTFLEGFFN
ncbi:hypothetical protein SynA1544_01626 [Synechococcus sp. A15-44]|nr:hypothetical protein SynA1544_01626 [Synechococcus sp. A15-44]